MRNYKSTPFIVFSLSFTLSLPLLASAFSLPNFLKFTSATDTKNTDSVKVENLQSLRVFEPNRVFAQSFNDVPLKKDIVDAESTSFETDGGILKDDLNSSEEDNHSDNAVYTVQKGDSIYSIASYFGVTAQTITSYNHMTSKTVNVGDVLEVPSTPGIMYSIKKGDTLNSISKKYGVDPDDVSLYNGLFSGDDLAIGDDVFLPGAKETDIIIKKEIKKSIKNISLGTIKVGSWAKGDTAHLNTSGDIAKYSALPKYPGYYLMPAPGAVRTQKMHGHNGVDLSNKIGSPILASADGVVRVAKTGGYNFGYGNYIIVTHSNGSETVYAHLFSVNVSPGQSVTRGQQIAKLGSSGNSTGPHIHFEIRGAYNPFAW